MKAWTAFCANSQQQSQRLHIGEHKHHERDTSAHH